MNRDRPGGSVMDHGHADRLDLEADLRHLIVWLDDRPTRPIAALLPGHDDRHKKFTPPRREL